MSLTIDTKENSANIVPGHSISTSSRLLSQLPCIRLTVSKLLPHNSCITICSFFTCGTAQLSPVFIDRLLPARRTITNLAICIQVLFSLWPSLLYAGITLLQVYLTGYVVSCTVTDLRILLQLVFKLIALHRLPKLQ